MGIENYKQGCLDGEVRREENEVRWKYQYNEQKKYGDCYKPRRRFFKKMCPYCGEKLKEIFHYHRMSNMRMNGLIHEYSERYVFYNCGCGYVYAQ